MIKDNILYNKDMTTLIQVLNGYDSNTLVIPDTVTTIANGAFYQGNIQYITIPESVTTIGEQAFYNSAIRGITLPKSIKNIGKSAFESCVSLYTVEIEDDASFEIPEKCFYNQFALNEIYIPSSIPSIADNAFDAISRSVTFIGQENSVAETFVNNKISAGKNFKFSTEKKQILANVAGVEYSPDTNSSKYYYTGENVRPSVTVRFGSKVLTENVDYTLTYPSESCKVGFYQVKVTGINDYEGEYNVSYSVIGYPSIATVECKKEAYLNENWAPVINNPENQDYYIMYRYPSDDYASAVSTKPNEAGKYYICINFRKSEKYEAKTVTKRIILKDPIIWNITFDANGGTGTMDFIQIYEGDNFTFPKNNFIAPNGKVFAGWEIAGYETYQPGDIIENITSNYTIKANWIDEPTYYTVSFETNGGTTLKSQQVIEGNYAVIPSTTTKYGYVFKGWYKDANFNEEFDFDTNLITSDTMIYAKWNKIITTVNCTIAKPVEMEHPDYTAMVTDSDKYEISNIYWYLYEDSYLNLEETDTFEKNKEYAIRIIYIAKDGYEFTDDTQFLINGENSSRFEGVNNYRESRYIASEHVHTWDTGSISKEPTCTEKGEKTYTCTSCSISKTEEIDALGHEWDDGDIVKEATCTQTGTKVYHCLHLCGKTKTEEIAALGHEWDDGDIVKEATCTQTGTKVYHCLHLCGETKTETIAMITHNYTTTTDTTKATLKSNGKIVTTKKCTVCGNVASTNTTTIAYPKTIKLKTTSYTYNGKTRKPEVIVTDSNGKTIASSNYTVTYSNKNSKNVGKYSVTITFKGNYSGTKRLTYDIKPKGTSLKKLTASSKQFKATWTAQKTQTTGYQIQYSTNKNFKSGNKTVKITKNKTTSSTVKKLKSKKKYYVRIRTYKTVKFNGKGIKIYSSWSKVKNVTTKK